MEMKEAWRILDPVTACEFGDALGWKQCMFSRKKAKHCSEDAVSGPLDVVQRRLGKRPGSGPHASGGSDN